MSVSKDQTLTKSINLVLRHYWAQVRLNPWLASMSLLLPGIGNILVFYLPTLVIARLIEHLNNASGVVTFSETVPYILLFSGFWLVGEAMWRVALHFVILFEAKAMARLNKDALDFLLEKDQKFFSDNFTGSLTKRAIAYPSSFVGLWDVMFFTVFPSIVSMVFAGVVLWRYSPWIVVILFGLVAVTLSILVPLIRRRRRLVRIREELSNKVTGHISDTIINMSAVQAFGRRQDEAQRHYDNVDELVAAAKKSWDYQNLRVDMVIAPLYVFINVLGLIMALTLGKGTGDTAAIFVTFNYFGNVTRILWEFNRIYRNIETSLTEAAQFTELLLEEPRIKDPQQPEAVTIHRGAVEFKNITFKHSGAKKPIFDQLSLRIKPGEKVGLVGHSGSGKTTLTRLLLRFSDVQKGSVTIDTQDITKVAQDELRQHIAYVPQEPLLFHRTIAENISYGTPDASQKVIEGFAKMAHAHEFIKDLPDGYDTLVGERGVKLSGGQRQRVAIARAMIKNAPILVLDEATSALDSESEGLIQDALWKLMEHRTAIVIAHRLSTIQQMDRIIVMDNGKIIEEGSHRDLIHQNGAYARLWAKQSGGFIDE